MPIPPVITEAVVARFHFLLVGYEAIGEERAISFGDWLVLNGVTDPREWCCMMWLYWHHVSRAALD